MMQQSDDRPDTELAQPPQPGVGPSPVDVVEAVRCQALPQHRESQGPQPDRCKAIEVALTDVVPRHGSLIEPPVTDAVHRALQAAPQFERRSGVGAGHAALATLPGRASPLSFEYKVSAWATTWSML